VTGRASLAALLLLCLGAAPAPAPLELPETSLAYRIEAALDPLGRRLEGRETIEWRNPSDEPIASVPIHLYLNAFAHEATSWMKSSEQARGDVDDLLELDPDPWGYSEPRSIRQEGVELRWQPIAPDDGNPLDRTLIEVELAKPVAPGATLVLEIDWDARLPMPIARTGGVRGYFFVAQWFPKLAAFYPKGDRERPQGGFDRHQFHAATEFFADFARYDVRMGAPRGWRLACTGRREPDGSDGHFDWYRSRIDAVHDFAWVVGQSMVEEVWQHVIPGGASVELRLLTPAGTERQIPRWRRMLERSLDVMSARLAPYPYLTLSAVLPPWNAAETGGMEYPTLIGGNPGDPLFESWPLAGLRDGELTLAHEFAHQYFYGLVASNEFEDAFLDEGFTQFWGNEILIDTYGDAAGLGEWLGEPLGVSAAERSSLPDAGTPLPPIWSGPSFLLRGSSWGTQFYTRPALSLLTAQRLFGRSALDRALQSYVRRWAFKHPRFEDVLASAEAAGEPALARFLREAFTRRELPDYAVKELESERVEPPRGERLSAERAARQLPELARGRDDDALEVDVLDPGYTAERRVSGAIARESLDMECAEPDRSWNPEPGVLWESSAHFTGPGWRGLPVEVELRFADGVRVRRVWDGRAPYLIVRAVRAAPLREARIDPFERVALDPSPANNGRYLVANRAFARAWSTWLGAAAQWLAELAAQTL
jgi:hypothetical protein